MEDGTVRVRLVFEDRHILSKLQKKEGLKRSWVLLQPQHHTISHFSSHLLHIFHLQEVCPHGLILSMDGFVLPPFESTFILKDKDIISVKRKGGPSNEINKVSNEKNCLEKIETREKQPVLPGVKLLAYEEFDKETGGYESESEEHEPERLEDVLHVEAASQDNKILKKRKASNKIQSSKRKKSKLATGQECPQNATHRVHVEKKLSSHQHGIISKESLLKKDKSSIPEIVENKSTPDAKRSSQSQENGEQNGDVSQTPSGTKKIPSRSARRKKAKRQWLREQAKLEKKELLEEQLLEKDNQQSSGNLIPKLIEEHQQAVQLSDVEDDFVPVEVRPGHIRFEPFSKDQAVEKTEIPVGTFQWNGISSKKKGQKWGKEKTTSKRNDYSSFSQECSQMLTSEVETSVNGCLDYDKLLPYSGLPKEEDVIAYRLIELSSSWTPELSSFRVGKILWYNTDSNKIRLVPVPEYPLEKKMGEEGSELQPDTSLYKEDGTLEIDFSSLVDVRVAKHGNSNIAKSVIDKDSEACVAGQDAKVLRPNNNNEEVHAPEKVNGRVNVWEEISQALSAKKAELSKADAWSKKESSGRSPWSYKALRGSALGPTMALLRAQNGV